MIAQLERLRLGILREGLARTDSDRKQREQTNGRLDPPEDRSGTRYTRGGSMRDEIDHPSRPTGLRRFPVAFCRLLNPT